MNEFRILLEKIEEANKKKYTQDDLVAAKKRVRDLEKALSKEKDLLRAIQSSAGKKVAGCVVKEPPGNTHTIITRPDGLAVVHVYSTTRPGGPVYWHDGKKGKPAIKFFDGSVEELCKWLKSQ